MRLIENIANYALGNITTATLPQIAVQAIEEGIESESLIILAGMSENDNVFEILSYYQKSLSELGLDQPGQVDSAKIILRYYLKRMVSSPQLAYPLMIKIDNDIYRQVDWGLINSQSKGKYIGEELGLEVMYTWYRAMQDCDDDNSLFDSEIIGEKRRLQYRERLVEEAKILLEKLAN